MTVKETLIRAIDDRHTVRILYKGAERVIEPYVPLRNPLRVGSTPRLADGRSLRNVASAEMVQSQSRRHL